MGNVNLAALRYRLNQYRIILSQKKELELQLEEIEDEIGIKAIGYDSIGGGSGKVSRNTENQAINLADKKQSLKMTIAHKKIEVERIENALEVLNPSEKEIIELKHIKDHKWETVYYMLNKTDKTCRALERKALQKMLDILNYTL